MKNKRILAAIAAVSVLSLATGASVFAMTSPETKANDESVSEETDAAATDVTEAETAEAETSENVTTEAEDESVESTSAEAENAEDETTEADEAVEKVKPPHAEKKKPLVHADIDVTDFFYEIKDSIYPDDYDFIPETIIANWDNIRKIKVHFDFNMAEAEKPAAPAKPHEAKEVKGPNHVDLDVTDIFYQFKDRVNVDNYDIIPDAVKENWDNVSKVKVHVDFNKAEKDKPEKPEKPAGPADREDGKKPECPTPPVKNEDGEKPAPPTPPAKNEDGEKPAPPAPPAKNEDGEKPTPPHKLHEAEKAAGEEAENTTNAEISE